MRIIDFDPEFTWDAGEPFPVALIERARQHARRNDHRQLEAPVAFEGAASCWNPLGDWRGISFVVLRCASCGQEIGRGIVWREPPSDNAYPWQAGYWARVSAHSIFVGPLMAPPFHAAQDGRESRRPWPNRPRP